MSRRSSAQKPQRSYAKVVADIRSGAGAYFGVTAAMEILTLL